MCGRRVDDFVFVGLPLLVNGADAEDMLCEWARSIAIDLRSPESAISPVAGGGGGGSVSRCSRLVLRGDLDFERPFPIPSPSRDD